jgi:hypothetical protein
MCFLEQREVLHDPEAGHGGEHLAQLAERLPISVAQPVEQSSAAGVGQGSEHGVHPWLLAWADAGVRPFVHA